MPFDPNLEGRHEKRLPIVVVVSLAGAESPQGDGEEKTYTDNVSPYGARVVSRHYWHAGEEARVTPFKYGTPARARVVYCRKLANERFFVGLDFSPRRVHWSNFAYPGVS